MEVGVMALHLIFDACLGSGEVLEELVEDYKASMTGTNFHFYYH